MRSRDRERENGGARASFTQLAVVRNGGAFASTFSLSLSAAEHQQDRLGDVSLYKV